MRWGKRCVHGETLVAAEAVNHTARGDRWIRGPFARAFPEALASEISHLSRSLCPRGFGVATGFVLVVTLPDLLLDLLGHLVDRRIEVGVGVGGKEIGPAYSETEGAGERFLGGAGMIVFQSDSRVDCPTVEMLQFVDADKDMIFDRLGVRDVMRRENKFHVNTIEGL